MIKTIIDTLRRRLKGPLPGFDAAYYLDRYPDVAAAEIDPETHFLQHGWKEGRDPCRYFSVSGYLDANPDVRAAGINPLIHFWNHGLIEGRSGWEHRDERAYRLSPEREPNPSLNSVSRSPLARR